MECAVWEKRFYDIKNDEQVNNKRKKMLFELKRIAAHFRLSLSSIEIFRKSAIGMDAVNKKLIVLTEKNNSFFKTIDLANIHTCAVKLDYCKIDAGDLHEKHLDDFIEKIQLKICHLDPEKSVVIDFYDMNKNAVHELRALISRATSWRDKIASMLPGSLLVRV